MKDKYDLAIEFLREHPDKIESAWCEDSVDIGAHQAHCLFERAGNIHCGCLTQIRGTANRENVPYPLVAATPELTKAIIEDERIPEDVDYIRVSDLPVFAEWQRRLDKELGRAP